MKTVVLFFLWISIVVWGVQASAGPTIQSMAFQTSLVTPKGLQQACITRAAYKPPDIQILYCRRDALTSRFYQVTINPGSVVFVPSETRLDGTGDVLCSSEPFDGADMIVDVLGSVVRMYPVPPVPPSW